MSFESQSVFDYIFGLTVPGVKLELSRVEEFLSRLGRPFSSYPVIHIAGTNGKGSTAAMLASILDEYGYKTGLFTSPHLLRPNERIRIGSIQVPDEFITEKVMSWRSDIDELGITFFEVLTALSMVYFQEQQVDIAVVEVGLGGRLDATNVVDPVISIITAISMDHENILGSTIEQIAGEKAGIIKTNRPLVLGRNPASVCQIMKEVCSEKGAEILYVPDEVRIECLRPLDLKQQLQVAHDGKSHEFLLPLMGRHQAENFSNVLVALRKLGLPVDTRKIQNGLDKLRWGGRLQTLHLNPRVLYDVAHNPAGLDRLMETLIEADMGDTILIAAFNARKNMSTLLGSLKEWKGSLLFTVFDGHSAVGRSDLIRQGIASDLICQSPERAYKRALQMLDHDQQAICFFGSHYLAEALFSLFDNKAW